MTRFLFLSNGHGEDFSGALLAKELKENGYSVDSIPLVGSGSFYSKFGISIIGKTKVFNTGGLGYTTLKGRIQELIDGQLIYLLKILLRLILVRRKYDFLVVIKDVVPIITT